MGYSAPGERTLHDAYAAAGTTWWLESLARPRGSRDRVETAQAVGAPADAPELLGARG